MIIIIDEHSMQHVWLESHFYQYKPFRRAMDDLKQSVDFDSKKFDSLTQE